MKKSILSLMFVLSAGICHAVSPYQYEDWRSSDVVLQVNPFLISTGTIYIRNIYVSSGVTGSYFQFYNSTTTNAALIGKPSMPFATATSGVTIPIDKTLTKGLVFTSTNTVLGTTLPSNIRIRWNYPYGIPAGNETLGY